jgi:hypothetical protein
MTYSIIAAAPPANSSSKSSSSSKLKLLKVGRFIHLASDTALVDKKRMRQVSNAGAEVWGSKDGWDGVLLPRRKPRRRLAGWEVEGGRGSSGSIGDEEFDEVVFLQPGEQDDSALGNPQFDDAWGSGSDSDSDGKQRKHRKQQGSAAAAAAVAAAQLNPRFYSDDEGDEVTGFPQRQLQGHEEDRALPGGMEAPFMADLQQVRGICVAGGGGIL